MASHRLLSVGGILLVLASVLPAQGQVPLSPRALGMSGAVVGTAQGHDALFVNPANLALPGSPHWSVAIPQLTLGGTLDGLEFSDLPDLRRYDKMSNAQKNELLGRVPESGAELRFDVRAPLVVVQRRRLAFGVAFGALGEQRLSKDIFELGLNGYEPGRIDYESAGTAGSKMTFWDFAVGYGDRIGPVTWGVAAHYLRGRTLLRSWVTEPRFDLAGSDIDTDLVSVFLRGGNGFAVDVGATYQPHHTVTLSGAVANAFATMKWSDELNIRNLHLNKTSIEEDFFDLLHRYNVSERLVSPADAAMADGVTARSLQAQAYLPTTARLGVGWQPAARTQLGLSYYGALTGGQLSGSWDRMLGVGVQQRIPLLTLRAGYATNFAEGTMLSGGLSLGGLELGIAKLDDGPLEAATRTGWIGAVGLNMRTRSIMR
jgi:hypothetical protein